MSRRFRQKLHFVIAMFTLVLLASATALAQYDTGTIAGTVRDKSGALIGKAEVKLLNTGTGRELHAASGSNGEYAFPSLPVGHYSITVSMSGFGTAVVSDIVLNAAETRSIDVVLQVGQISQQVTVTAEQASVDTLTSDLNLSVGSKRVSDLPLNGRDFTSLIALVPGSVVSAPLFQTSLSGFDTSIIGTSVLLDGADATRIDTNSITTQLGRQESRITRASVDSIEEFSVLQGNYSAEYGRSVGNIVSVITKSGTNQYHGDLFDYFRNDYLDARNYFAVPGSPAPFRLNQFGGNLGGPLAKDKLFFFVNYEGVRQDITNSERFNVLNDTQRALFVPSMAPVVAAIPRGNGGPVPGSTIFDYYYANLRNTLREDTGSVRVDYNYSAKHTFTARYNINDSNTQTQYAPADGQTAPNNARSQFAKLSWSYVISPTLLNQAGFAMNKEDVNDFGGGGGFPLLSCFLCDFGVAPGPDLFSQISPQTSYQALDTVTKTAGRHTIHFGADIRWNLSDRELQQQANLIYASVSDFENNNGFALSTLGYPLTRVRNTNYDFFVQDDFRLLSNLTLNFGLRYEYNSVLHALGGRIQNFDIPTQTLLPAGQQLYAPDRNNFGPRFGFSWDPYKKGETVIRGGVGIFYNPQLTGSVLSLAGNNVLNLNVNVFDLLFGTVNCTPPLSLTYPVPATLPTCTPFAPYNVNQIDPKMRDTYSEHWNFGVQQELARNTVLDVDYVGNHSLKLPAGAGYAGLELNVPDPVTGIRPLSNTYADERLLGDFLHSRYDGLQAALRHHSGRLAMDANYTWSHEYDNAPNIFAGFQNNLNPEADYSDGDIDVRHNFTADILYSLPSWNALGKKLGGGWQLGSLISARSGLPVNIINAVNPFENIQTRPNFVPGQNLYPGDYSVPGNQLNAAAFSPGPNGSFGNIPRNVARGPGFWQFDISVLKNTQLTERVGLQFRGEIFNIFNHPNFVNPDGALADATFGQSSSTVGNLVGIGTSRQIQLALKIIF